MSVLGLLVNLFGIVAFRSSHSHGHGGHGHSHGGGHGHSHGGGHNHGHSHGGEGHQDRNANMEGRNNIVKNRRTNIINLYILIYIYMDIEVDIHAPTL